MRSTQLEKELKTILQKCTNVKISCEQKNHRKTPVAL
jgi:hypothetical protein